MRFDVLPYNVEELCYAVLLKSIVRFITADSLRVQSRLSSANI